MAILRAFQDFPGEATIIGRMLAGYADLEIDLMNCANAMRGDLDLTLKTMFRGRGNAQRIDIADALGRVGYEEIGLLAEFERAVSAVRFCLKIRNMYAHCNWWNDNTGQLAFANLEELADENVRITDLLGVDVHHVTVAHLQQQFAYFEYADNVLIGVIQEGNRRRNKPNIPGLVVPPPIAQPAKYL